MSAPIIFSGASAKLLKPILDFFGNAQILSGTVDPSITATTAPKGSLYLNTSTGFTYRKLDAGSTTNWAVTATLQNFSTQLFNGTGAQTVYTLTTAPGSLNNTFVFISGVYQQKNTYTLAGTTVTFSTAPPAGTSNIEINYNSALPIGTPADNTVSTVKIVDAAVTTLKIADASITQAKLAARATGTSVTAGGVALSASSGNFSTTSTTLVAVTNLSVTITTTGRPVAISLVDDGTASGSYVGVKVLASSTFNSAFFALKRGATQLTRIRISAEGAPNTGTASAHSFVPPSSISHLDMPSAGTYTYTLEINSADGTNTTAFVNAAKLLAYEL